MVLRGFVHRGVSAALAAGALSLSITTATAVTGGASPKAPPSAGGTATVALDEDLAGFNINTSGASEPALQEILNMVWPQAFIVNNELQPSLNNQLLESAVQASDDPQTIVYTLNPKAVWSDGTPITADDFIYNWQAQSGNAAYTDVGGKPYDVASEAGYNQILSVVGSNPSGGAACAAGSSADRNVGLCPNGRTVTVTFKSAFADWRELFSNIVPAHIARTVGWNTGFVGPTQTISGSWYTITGYDEDRSLVLTRNPTYWGTPGKLHKIVFRFFSDDIQLVPALQDKSIDIFSPSSVDQSIVQAANQVPDTTNVTLPGLEFEHLDFNQADPYLANLEVREAIAHGVNRETIIDRTVGKIDKGLAPLGSRMLMPKQAGYQNTPYAYNPGQSRMLLTGLGFKKGADGYFQPTYGPQEGHDLTFTIESAPGDALRDKTEDLFQAQMKAIGIKIDVKNYSANTLFGTNLSDGAYQIAEFAWVSTPYPSGNMSKYCSYTNAALCYENWTHSASPQVDQLMNSGAAAPSQSQESADFNQADAILWQNMVTLPLYQKPLLWAWSDNLKGVLPTASSAGVTWNAEDWTFNS